MADSTLIMNTTNLNSVCSNFKSKVSSIDLGGIDVTSMFEPFTSVGVLTSYVPSLKDALKTITDNCNSLIGILQNLVDTQQNIDDNGAQNGNSGYFTDYGGNNSYGNSGGNSGGYSGGYSGGSSSNVNNGNSTIGIKNPSVEDPITTLQTDPGFMQSLISIASTSPTALTSADRASYLKDLLKIKNQNNQNTVSIIDSVDPTVLQTYLKSIINGELPITNVAQSVTFDILERIAKERNINLTELITAENVNDIRQKVEELSQEYLTIFNSNNLQTDLLNIYDGATSPEMSDDFISSIRTAIDIIAINKDITAEELLGNEANASYLKEEIGKVTEALSQIRLMGTKSNAEFVDSLTKLFGESQVIVTPNGDVQVNEEAQS
jgi:hypothetical protein